MSKISTVLESLISIGKVALNNFQKTVYQATIIQGNCYLEAVYRYSNLFERHMVISPRAWDSFLLESAGTEWEIETDVEKSPQNGPKGGVTRSIKPQLQQCAERDGKLISNLADCKHSVCNDWWHVRISKATQAAHDALRIHSISNKVWFGWSFKIRILR